MIFSLLANSKARSKGILSGVSIMHRWRRSGRILPNTLQVHWPNLDNVACLLALEDTVTSASCHASDVEKFRAVDHVIVWARVSFIFGGTFERAYLHDGQHRRPLPRPGSTDCLHLPTAWRSHGASSRGERPVLCGQMCESGSSGSLVTTRLGHLRTLLIWVSTIQRSMIAEAYQATG